MSSIDDSNGNFAIDPESDEAFEQAIEHLDAEQQEFVRDMEAMVKKWVHGDNRKLGLAVNNIRAIQLAVCRDMEEELSKFIGIFMALTANLEDGETFDVHVGKPMDVSAFNPEAFFNKSSLN
jgi:hypothetical protein